MKFKLGDVVMFVGGGSTMTVNYIESKSGYIECVWFDKDLKLKTDIFDPLFLKLV